MVRTVFKYPSGPGLAMSFVGLILTLIGDHSIELTVRAIETGITGIREAVIMQDLLRFAGPKERDQLLQKKTMPMEWKFERYEPGTRGEFAYLLSDDEIYDQRLPLHPLTRVRRWLKWIEKTYEVSLDLGMAPSERAQSKVPEESAGLFLTLKRVLVRDETVPRLSFTEPPNHIQIEIRQPAFGTPPIGDIQRELGKEVANDLQYGATVPLAERQQKCREQMNRELQACMATVTKQNTKPSVKEPVSQVATLPDVTADISRETSLDPQFARLAGLKEELEKVPQLLPGLLLATSAENEKCWLLETPAANVGLTIHLDGVGSGLLLFSDQALADDFAIRKQLSCRSLSFSIRNLFGRLTECRDHRIVAFIANMCPVCVYPSVKFEPLIQFASEDSLLKYWALQTAIHSAQVKWSFGLAVQEMDLEKRLGKLATVVIHGGSGAPEVHLELIRTARLLNHNPILLESAHRIQKYAPARLKELLQLISAPDEHLSNEVLQQQRANIFALLSIYWQLTDQHQESIDFFSEYLSRNSDDATAYGLRGGSLWYAGELQKAIDDFSRALLLSPGDILATSGRGQVLADCGKFNQALQDLDFALKVLEHSQMDPTQKNCMKAYALNGRAAAYAGLGESERAHEDFARSVGLCPKNAWVYFNQAVALERWGDINAAIVNYKRSLTMNEPKLNLLKRTHAETKLKMLQEAPMPDPSDRLHLPPNTGVP
jgi:tetratricopeptide (TPR) repeat protein